MQITIAKPNKMQISNQKIRAGFKKLMVDILNSYDISNANYI